MRNTYCFIRYVQNGKLAFQGGGVIQIMRESWKKLLSAALKTITIRLKIAICKSYKNENTQFIKNITYCMIRTRTAFYRTKLDSSFFFDIYKTLKPIHETKPGFITIRCLKFRALLTIIVPFRPGFPLIIASSLEIELNHIAISKIRLH